MGAIAEKCRRYGISWVAVKAADGSVLWSQFRRALMLRELGVKVFSWSYNYGRGDEASVVNAALASGSDGHIFDIEAEFARAPNPHDAARRLFDHVQRAHPDKPLAYSPLPVVGNFPQLPYNECNSWTSAVVPQFYTKALGTGSNYPLERLMRIWREWQSRWLTPARAITPALQGYGGQTAMNLGAEASVCMTEYGGFSVWRWGTLTPAMWSAIGGA